MKVNFKFDDKDFQKTLKEYSKLSSLNLGDVIKKRATNVAFKLIKAYRAAAPTKAKIDSDVAGLNYKVRTGKKGNRKQQLRREIASRKRHIGFTAMGWVIAAKNSGIGFKSKVLQKFTGKPTGEGSSKLSGKKPFASFENTLPGADVMEKKHGIISQVMKAETKDMRVYIERKVLKQKNKNFK